MVLVVSNNLCTFINNNRNYNSVIKDVFFQINNKEVKKMDKTLSDKIITADGLHHEVEVCVVGDIKKTIKDIEKDIEKAYRESDSDTGLSDIGVISIIDKRIGEKLKSNH